MYTTGDGTRGDFVAVGTLRLQRRDPGTSQLCFWGPVSATMDCTVSQLLPYKLLLSFFSISLKRLISQVCSQFSLIVISHVLVLINSPPSVFSSQKHLDDDSPAGSLDWSGSRTLRPSYRAGDSEDHYCSDCERWDLGAACSWKILTASSS